MMNGVPSGANYAALLSQIQANPAQQQVLPGWRHVPGVGVLPMQQQMMTPPTMPMPGGQAPMPGNGPSFPGGPGPRPPFGGRILDMMGGQQMGMPQMGMPANDFTARLSALGI